MSHATLRTLAGAAFVAALAALALPASAQQDGTGKPPPVFDGRAADEIRAIVRQYLIDNPDVILEAVQALQARQRVDGKRRQREAIAASEAELTRAADDPSLGTPGAPLVIVEFFDYACGYCKAMIDVMVDLVEKHKDVRLVLKELPILSPVSEQAARTALALAMQDAGKYRAFHIALLRAKTLNETVIERAARATGADMKRLERDLALPAIDTAIRANHALARRLGITGTPAIIVGDTLVPGTISAEELDRLVGELREKRAAR
ncbi:MAG: DsbA family protein [Alphaproteobacteria bacterium]|nr:DsbA family protein [Alphaproteobacteria bacterium]